MPAWVFDSPLSVELIEFVTPATEFVTLDATDPIGFVADEPVGELVCCCGPGAPSEVFTTLSRGPLLVLVVDCEVGTVMAGVWPVEVAPVTGARFDRPFVGSSAGAKGRGIVGLVPVVGLLGGGVG